MHFPATLFGVLAKLEMTVVSYRDELQAALVLALPASAVS